MARCRFTLIGRVLGDVLQAWVGLVGGQCSHLIPERIARGRSRWPLVPRQSAKPSGTMPRWFVTLDQQPRFRVRRILIAGKSDPARQLVSALWIDRPISCAPDGNTPKLQPFAALYRNARKSSMQ